MTEVVAAFYDGEIRAGFIICPFHDDRSPSLKIYRDSFYCFGCGVGGDSVDFVALLNDVKPIEAARAIAARFNLAVSDEAHSEPLDLAAKAEAEKLQKKRRARAYFEEMELRAFRNLARYRDTVIKAVQRVGGLDGVDAELAAHMHRLPIVEDYLTVMATGSAAERLELFREGVFNIWASL